MTTKPNSAFSLLELMVTLAIVLIISLIAYPVLNQYFVQGKVADAINSAAAVQSMVTSQIALNQSVTDSGTGLTTPTTISRYVSAYSVSSDGVISLTTTPDAGGVTLTLTPVYNATSDQVSWACAVSNSNMDDFVPNECRI